jgi:hypothetical protein
MPYKSLLFRNVAGCGPASSFNRWTSLDVACNRRSLAPRLAPLSGFRRCAADKPRYRRLNRNSDRIAIPAWPVDTDGYTPRGNRLDAPATRQTAVGNATGHSASRDHDPRPTHGEHAAGATRPGTSSNPQPAGTLPRRHPGAPNRRPARPDASAHQGITNADPGPSVRRPPRTTTPTRDRRSAPVLRTCRIAGVGHSDTYALFVYSSVVQLTWQHSATSLPRCLKAVTSPITSNWSSSHYAQRDIQIIRIWARLA